MIPLTKAQKLGTNPLAPEVLLTRAVRAIYLSYMALLNDSVGFKKLDVRMIERNVARGVVSPEEVKKAVEQLPDDSANADWSNIDVLMHDTDESETNGRAPLHQH